METTAAVVEEQDGPFPIDRLVSFYDFEQVEGALDASHAGDVIEPILRMPG